MGADLQFALEQRQVVGNGFAADIQLLGNLARRGAFGEHDENLQFARSHAVQAWVAGILPTGQLSGQRLIDVGMPGEHASHRFDQHLRRRAFGQIACRPGIQRLTHQRQFIVHAEKQDPQLRQALPQAPGGFQAADARQAKIHDHQMRHAFLDPNQRLFAARGFPHLHCR
ncbi:hypothetical protein D3C87_1606240 [compost metagenome]